MIVTPLVDGTGTYDCPHLTFEGERPPVAPDTVVVAGQVVDVVPGAGDLASVAAA